MNTPEAVRYLRERFQHAAHPAAADCKLCEALDTLIAAAELGAAADLALQWMVSSKACDGCPAFAICQDRPQGARQLCIRFSQFPHVWIEAARKEAAPAETATAEPDEPVNTERRPNE